METLELIEYFRFEADRFYPFIPFDSLTLLTETVIGSRSAGHDLRGMTDTKDWSDDVDSRNLDLLRLVLACAVVSKTKEETEISRHLMSIAGENVTTKLDGPNFDAKDITILTLIVSVPQFFLKTYI